MPAFPQFHFDRHDPRKHYTRSLFSEDTYVFAQDLNEAQRQTQDQIRANGDALFVDGDVLSGDAPVINVATGVTRCPEAGIYIQGHVRHVPETTITIPVQGNISVGVIIEERIVSSLDDPDLIFSSQNFQTHGEPLAPRLQQRPRWGGSNEALIDTAEVSYRFFPIYAVINGVVADASPPPQISGASGVVARYDYEANGHYVSRGFTVRHLGLNNGAREFSIEEGSANVRGVKIDRTAATRLRYPDDPDLETINAEPHYFNDGGAGTLVIPLNRTPVAEILDVSVLTEKTTNVLRGQTSGGRDPLPDAQIAGVQSITQGGTTYSVGTDFTLVGDEIDWSPGGIEPAPGSTYSVEYTYKKSITPDSFDEDSVTVSGAVTGSEVDIDYRWQMPRIDLVTLGTGGAIARIKGVSRPYDPSAPSASDDVLILAQIESNWRAAGPVVRNVGVRAVPFDEIQALRGLVVQTYDQLARVELRQNASSEEAAAVNGIFVDNFVDDDQRDQGLPQTAAIVEGELTLPITATVIDTGLSGASWTLDYTTVVAISQPQRTGSMKVNPYQAFEPIPAQITLDPATDFWTDRETIWASSTVRRLTSSPDFQINVRQQLLGETTTEIETLRIRDVDVHIEGFGPEEQVEAMLFDGVDVMPDPAPQSDLSGAIDTVFTIPAGIPAGSKEFELVGESGSRGSANFVGRGTLITSELRRTTIVSAARREVFDVGADPLAQTFTPSEGIHFAGAKVRFDVVGDISNTVIMQLRRTTAGLPNDEVLADALVNMGTVSTGGWTEIQIETPLWLEANTEYALVFLTDDADHAMGIAELGKFDPANGWVTAQPYQIGILASSSNARAWQPHHDRDMTFEILRASYTEAERRVPLGSIPAATVTDLLALAGVETPAAGAEAELVFRLTDGSEILASPNLPVALAEALENEDLVVEAILRGTESASPVLFPNPQVVLGVIEDEGVYISRAFRGGTGVDAKVTLEALLPGASTVACALETAPDVWTDLTLDAQDAAGDGWQKLTYRLTGATASTLRVKLTLSGTALHRPRARNLAALTLAV